MQVESSAIRAIDYDERQRRLQVRFTSGEDYVYETVPPEVHSEFVAADSKGRFFTARIRDHFPFRRLKKRSR